MKTTRHLCHIRIKGISLFRFLLITFLYLCAASGSYSQTRDFLICDKYTLVTIICDTADYPTVRLSARLLADDIERVTGRRPAVRNNLAVKGNVIIIGSIDRSGFMKTAPFRKQINVSALEGKWESYEIKNIPKPAAGITNALVICGSDKRGTAYGVFDIAEKIGVSPWYWWADVTPRRKEKISIQVVNVLSPAPSVKYRGIFLNDEDWGLQPWAAKTFEPDTRDIGPKTYARIFELLLRLKANLIWPAMHPSTKAFYHYPENRKVADEYGIVVGSSHAEPMLRNNVDEWNPKSMGDYNYITNRQMVYNYWKQRAEESKSFENIYTIGMRGVHDSKMEGASTIAEQKAILAKIFADQREILSRATGREAVAIPQAFIPYKEVLEVYDQGLEVPEDITIVWPDDNYGYIHRLNNEKEMKRSGGAGVYYHVSYWGRPHDYLWLSGTHPMLIWEEMLKAYQTESRTIWVVNVGDLKPHEYEMNLFLDMAYNMDPFLSPSYVRDYRKQWLSEIFGEENSAGLEAVTWEYSQLAFERRPEFMGWGQTEPIRVNKFTEYNHFYYNDEAQRRLNRYSTIAAQVRGIKSKIPDDRQDAFFQLVHYPVRCAELINRKFLLNERAYYYAQQNRLSANTFAAAARQAYDSIVLETEYFNTKLANGKWQHMMSMRPRGLPVFDCPMTPSWTTREKGWGISVEGYTDIEDRHDHYGNRLPDFNVWTDPVYFIDIFLTGNESVQWQAETSNSWITLSQSSGVLKSVVGKNETRIWVRVNQSLLPKASRVVGRVVIKGAGREFSVPLNVLGGDLSDVSGFAEQDGYVSIYAENYTTASNSKDYIWSVIDGLGYSGKAVMLTPATTADRSPTGKPSLQYNFTTFTDADATVNIYCLPVHALNADHQMRVAVSIDGQEPQVIDYRTFGRSDVWKQNVLRNSAEITLENRKLSRGKHSLTITALDPGIIIDRITVDLGGLRKGYSAIPETKVRGTAK